MGQGVGRRRKYRRAEGDRGSAWQLGKMGNVIIIFPVTLVPDQFYVHLLFFHPTLTIESLHSPPQHYRIPT
jgi:hypothetical protein